MPIYSLFFFVVSCFAAVILVRLWRRPYPRASKSLNVWFGPLPEHGENQVRYHLRDALYALAWFIGVVLPVLLFAKLGVEFGRHSDTPASLQVALLIFLGLSYLMFFNVAICLIKAFFLTIFRTRQVFNENLGKFVTERNYR